MPLPFLTHSPDCDVWVSEFSKSPLAAGTKLPPFPQKEIKSQSVDAQRVAFKWKDKGKSRIEGNKGDRRKIKKVKERCENTLIATLQHGVSVE